MLRPPPRSTRTDTLFPYTTRFRSDLTLAVPDHNLPTTARVDANGNRIPIMDPESAQQLAALERNAPEFGIKYIGATDIERSEEHTSELQSLMRSSYAVFCLKKTNNT